MDQWKSLLARFLRNECNKRENAIVYHALRYGLIDDEFRSAIESVLSDQDTEAYINSMKPISGHVLKDILCRIEDQKAKPSGSWRIILECLKIAAIVAVTLSVSWLIFHPKTQKEEPLAMNTLTVPAGQTVKLTLADGTNIWLNSRSILKYPGVFTGDRREVILDGEGFFDVAYDLNKPFVVHAGGYEIQALGTEFDVETYSQKGFVTSLLDGSVQITSLTDTAQTIILQPNTMALLQENQLVSDAITDFDRYRWREGLICFKEIPFVNLMALFEKYYGIKIVVENRNIKNYVPTGKFRQSDGIDYALRVLQRNFRFKFERDEENHIMYIK